jgi:hypothetical protein
VAANGRRLIASGREWIGIQSKHLPGVWAWRKSQTVSFVTTHDLAGHLPKTINPHSTHTHTHTHFCGGHYGCSTCFFTTSEQTSDKWTEFMIRILKVRGTYLDLDKVNWFTRNNFVLSGTEVCVFTRICFTNIKNTYINDLNTFSSDLIPFCCSVFYLVPFFHCCTSRHLTR